MRRLGDRFTAVSGSVGLMCCNKVQRSHFQHIALLWPGYSILAVMVGGVSFRASQKRVVTEAIAGCPSLKKYFGPFLDL